MNAAASASASPAALLRLGPELTIYSAAEVRLAILARMDGAAALTLDLADVCECDSAGVQLLLAARRTVHARGAALRLEGHSAAMHDAFALLGLDAQLNQLDYAPEAS